MLKSILTLLGLYDDTNYKDLVKSGVRSASAKSLLSSKGYNVYNGKTWHQLNRKISA